MNYIGIDIGGSTIKGGIVDLNGKIINKISFKTPMDSYESLLSELKKIVDWAKSYTVISGIGLSLPCVTDAYSGIALSDGALVYINGKNPAMDLGKAYNLPYSADNDGNCAAYSEVWIGKGKGLNSFALVVCGTGIGGAVYINGKVIKGKNNASGEFGMYITDFENDIPKTWSANGSTLSVVKEYCEKTGKSPDVIDGKYVFDLSIEDPVASECVEKFYKNFSYGINNIQHTFDPEKILLGGAISIREDFSLKINQALDNLYKKTYCMLSRPVIEVCETGADANIVGAVYHLINSEL
jgi:glucokinase